MTLPRQSLAFLCLLGFSAPAALGQNPYLMTPPNVLQSPAARAANPWLSYSSPYTPYSAGAGMASPYAPAVGPGFNPYFPYYGFGGAGSALYGEAELLRGYGTAIINQEQTRILREQAMQAKIDTARKRFDFDLYVKANTPTYADEQKKIAKNTLKRIQNNSNPTEILNGKALNILLDDVRTFPLKKANMDPIPMSDFVLKQLNVTSKTVGVGLLRNDGKFTWPVGLIDIIPPDQLKTIEKQVQIAVSNAANGKIDAQLLADIGGRMDEIKQTLTRKINDLPTNRYLEADRFLNEFRDARQGVEDGQVAVQDRFNRFVVGGKTIQEVADYMVTNGLKFAAATSSDEAGYRALHSALVRFDVALNTDTPSTDVPPPQ